MAKDRIALIVGAGSGLGAALARRFAAGGYRCAVAARRADRMDFWSHKLGVTAFPCDATEEASVSELFARVSSDFGVPDIVVYNAGYYSRRGIADLTASEFEHAWQINCLGGFLVGRAAVQAMLPANGGSIFFTGATASLRGSAGFSTLAVGKFGLRALAQSMAREFGPQGIHVAHVIIDGQISDPEHGSAMENRLNPDAIAETYWHLHHQPRSAWTLEVDLRPAVEKF